MKTLIKKINTAGLIITALVLWSCEKTADQSKSEVSTNQIEKLQTLSVVDTPCKGKCCSFSQGYWFAKPNVVWPGTLTIGNQTYTKAEGQAIWDAAKGSNNSSLFKAFFQAAAIKLSGTSLTCSYQLKKDILYIQSVLSGLPKIKAQYLSAVSSKISSSQAELLQQKAGRIGDWIDSNHCSD